jgi:hypothetical protein
MQIKAAEGNPVECFIVRLLIPLRVFVLLAIDPVSN